MRLLLLLLLSGCSALPLDGSALKAMTESEELCRCEVEVKCN
jgi:hypothetical protein